MSLPVPPRWLRRAGPGLGVAALSLWSVGCACPDATTVLPIDTARYQSLLGRYGSEALPDYECEKLCPLQSHTPTSCEGSAGTAGDGGSNDGGAAGAGGSGGTGGATGTAGTGGTPCTEQPAFAYLEECKLATIEWTTPAVICTGTPPCM